jgi:uncharacterized protein YcgI (DUF1989 family)
VLAYSHPRGARLQIIDSGRPIIDLLVFSAGNSLEFFAATGLPILTDRRNWDTNKI